jgi:hypothetical protein
MILAIFIFSMHNNYYNFYKNYYLIFMKLNQTVSQKKTNQNSSINSDIEIEKDSVSGLFTKKEIRLLVQAYYACIYQQKVTINDFLQAIKNYQPDRSTECLFPTYEKSLELVNKIRNLSKDELLKMYQLVKITAKSCSHTNQVSTAANRSGLSKFNSVN